MGISNIKPATHLPLSADRYSFIGTSRSNGTELATLQYRGIRLNVRPNFHSIANRIELPLRHHSRLDYQGNIPRHGHSLIELMRIRASLAPGAEARTPLGEAIKCTAASATTGHFGRAGRHLREAVRLSTGCTSLQLQTISARLSSRDAPVRAGDQAMEQIGSQALAGIVCARLLPYADRPPLQPFQPVASLRSAALSTAAEALTSALVTCSSKEEVNVLLSDFVDMFRLGDHPLPAGRFAVLDEAREALAYCEAFDADLAGRSLSKPVDGFPLVEAKALEDTGHERWGSAVMA